jgi:toxin FitB
VILLDTNVVSELMRVAPDQAVLNWVNGTDANLLYLSTVTIGEIAYGLGILPDGRRRRTLNKRFRDFIDRAFAHRIADFDRPSALAYGELMASRRRSGRPMSMANGQIAAIARTRGFRVATRNMADFESCGLTLINPWTKR